MRRRLCGPSGTQFTLHGPYGTPISTQGSCPCKMPFPIRPKEPASPCRREELPGAIVTMTSQAQAHRAPNCFGKGGKLHLLEVFHPQ